MSILRYTKHVDTSRFFAKVTTTSTCWLWKGGTSKKGYGRFWQNGRSVAAHRFSYELVRGKIPEGKQIDHLCRRHNCVNPAHLEVVTPRENLMRGETLAAANAAKTHCPKGHQFTESNTYYTSAKRRLCKTCCKARNDATAEYRRRYYAQRSHHIMS